MAKSLSQLVWTSSNLHTAWRHVRKSAENSSRPELRAAAEEFESKSTRELNSIQSRLSGGTYIFPHATGVLKDRALRLKQGKNPRPIVVGSLESRIVQRAILQVLQPREGSDNCSRIGHLRLINKSKYGIGGLAKPYGGVEVGIARVTKDIGDGARYFYKSDIKSFFTEIPHQPVCDFLRKETGDERLVSLFEQALKVELNNKEALGKYFNLFPSNGVGVPQGSSLSALAGNILLYEMDQHLNSGDTSMYRYIDDVIILGDTAESVESSRKVIGSHLKTLGMSLYHPSQSPKKAAQGHVGRGFTFLGCQIMHSHVEPSKISRRNLLDKINSEISSCKKYISSIAKDHELQRGSQRAYVQALGRIDNIIHGWGHSYSFCTNRQPFRVLDERIDPILRKFHHWFNLKSQDLPAATSRRALGVSLLQDVDQTPLLSEKQSEFVKSSGQCSGSRTSQACKARSVGH